MYTVSRKTRRNVFVISSTTQNRTDSDIGLVSINQSIEIFSVAQIESITETTKKYSIYVYMPRIYQFGIYVGLLLAKGTISGGDRRAGGTHLFSSPSLPSPLLPFPPFPFPSLPSPRSRPLKCS